MPFWTKLDENHPVESGRKLPERSCPEASPASPATLPNLAPELTREEKEFANLPGVTALLYQKVGWFEQAVLVAGD